MTRARADRDAEPPAPRRPPPPRAEHDVVALQRLAGNAAVGRLLVQRLPYDEALAARHVAGPGGYEFQQKGGRLANGGTADLLVATKVPEQPSMLDALRLAAARFQGIAHAARATGLPLNGVMWPRNGAAMEPFVYRITVPYRAGGATRELELTYQYAVGTPGYVIGQRETAEGTATMAPAAIPPNAPAGYAPTFFATHAATGDTPLSGLLAQQPGLPQAANEARLDARTKLAAEGARFTLVRTHAERIADRSRIWTKLGGNRVAWVRFEDLWRNWLAVFGGDYGIADARVAAALRTPGGWTVAPRVERITDFGPRAADVEVA